MVPTRALLCICAMAAAAGTAHAGAFVVNPGPVVAGRTIVGSGQNMAPVDWRTYNAGPSQLPTVSWYYESGTAQRDQGDVAAAARRWINGRLRTLCPGTAPAAIRRCRVAVAFDIDDTLLGTWSYSKNMDPPLTFSSPTWNAYVAACGYAPITPTISLLNNLRSRGVYVAIVSAGAAAHAPQTTACLTQNGVKGWDSIRFRDPTEQGMTNAVYKARARSAVARRGYRIIASVGDQVSDMSWGHLERGFLLPNAMAYLN